jgi:hypothetical protein
LILKGLKQDFDPGAVTDVTVEVLVRVACALPRGLVFRVNDRKSEDTAKIVDETADETFLSVVRIFQRLFFKKWTMRMMHACLSISSSTVARKRKKYE